MIPIRDDVRSSSFALVNYVFIAANILIFIYELSLGRRLDGFIYQWAMIPAEITANPLGGGLAGPPAVATAFTSMFLHAGWEHLLGNMLFLWVFGDNVEDAMGHLRYLAFYLLAGLAAAGAQLLVSFDSQLPSLGASGAVSGVLGAYLVLYPRARVLTWVPVFLFLVIRVPAIVFLGLWFGFQFVRGLAAVGDGGMGGVAWWAHIGGFVAGMALISFFRRRSRYRLMSGW